MSGLTPCRFIRLAILSTLLVNISIAHAQQTDRQTPAQADDVVRIKTELVQTDVTILDRSGRFVEGLRPEQFQLTLDGKSEAVTFFELVQTGSASEPRKIAGARGATSKQNEVFPAANDRRRIIFFFLDDLHLSESSLVRARKALEEFIDNQMTINDQVAIVSASGQIGFLQQLTDYKPMLRTAAGRLNYKRMTEAYAGKVPISEYQAIQANDHNDRDLFAYLVLATINEYQSQGPLKRVAANIVKNRVRQISTQSRAVTLDTLAVLESLMKSSAALPGRKLVFFISDGFVTDVRSSNARPLLKRVTDMAAREGAVVYTMDARGTFNDSTVDAGRNDFPDGLATGTQARQPSLENSATQEPLHILADDTGGRAILNSNSFQNAFRQAIDETSEYYLLGWRPADEEQRNGRAKVKVTVKDRPDLRVRLRNNYYAPPEPEEKAEAAAKESPTAETGLLHALAAAYPQRDIPTSLAAGYVNSADKGLVLKASIQVDRAAFSFADGEDHKTLDVIGAALDDRGIIVTFKQVVNVAKDSASPNVSQPIIWNEQLKIQPGLYQVRVAVRERDTGRTGSAHQWIEVPDLAKGRLQLSSVFLGERKVSRTDEKFATGARSVTVDVDHRFARTSALRFQTYIYNASLTAGVPDVEIQAQVLYDNRAVMTKASVKLPTDSTKDLSRLPYWSEIALDRLPPGRYALQLVVTDRVAKSTATQTTSFVVE